MTALTWDDPADRTYENGISRVVFYPIGGTGVAWSGVTTIVDATPAPATTDLFVDGVKYGVFVGQTDFQAKLTAISLPDEFQPFIGEELIVPGYYLSHQPRPRFNLCYRTEATDGYKLHLIYNAIATLARRSHVTLNNSPSAPTVDVTINAVPTDVPIFRPTAHVIFDSAYGDTTFMSNWEDVLYGVAGGDDPRFPAFSEYGGTW